MVLASLIKILLLAEVAMGDLVLQQIQVVARHGSREHLPKNPMNLGEVRDAQLTPIGEQNMYELGTWLRDEYGDLLGNFTHNGVRLESSSFQRTLVSANAVAKGAFPDETRDPTRERIVPDPVNIPVYSTYKRNDLALRSHDKCSALTGRLQNLYGSDDWVNYENAHMNLLKNLASIEDLSHYVQGDYVPLYNVYNAFDMINVAKTECYMSSNPSCQNSTPHLQSVLSDADFDELREVAYFAEFQKFSWDTVGRRIGGNLIHKILERFVGVDIDQGIEVGHNFDIRKFYLYSAHYETIMGLLSSMFQGLHQVTNAIPGYGSALIFELYEDSETKRDYVRVRYRDPSSDTLVYVAVPGCDPGGCHIMTFGAAMTHGEYEHLKDWCNECGNEQSDVCLFERIQELEQAPRQVAGQGAAVHSSVAADCTVDMRLIVIAFLIGSMLSVLAMYFVQRNKQCSQKQNQASSSPQPSTTKAPTEAEPPVGVSEAHIV